MSATKLRSTASDVDFTELVRKVSKIVSEMAGIQLNDKQYSMVENRLKSRMIRLALRSPQDYLDYLKTHFEDESKELLSLLTTHHTYFFREFSHFEFLLKGGLLEVIAGARSRGSKKLRVWSAAASRGQEVYSLAMFLDLHLKQLAPDLDFEIWGTDVDPQSVAIGRNGVYPYKELKQVPAQYLGTHWVRGTGDISEFAKIKKAIKEKCHFGVLNLVQPHNFCGGEKFDLIFCRNVFIYFNSLQIKEVSKYLLGQLHSHGLLFIGVSETINGLGLAVDSVGPSVYRHPVREQREVVTTKVEMPPPMMAEVPAIIRVLCVDDSPSILALLKRVLSKETGFEVVATATNGLEAMEALKRHAVDIVTLDIHMPEMDGLTYLSKNMTAQHPPVIMISSVNRENADTAIKALHLGAADYVEKPSMANLVERGDEIRMKAKTALLMKKRPHQTQLDDSFSKKFSISHPEDKAEIFFAGLGDKNKIRYLVSNLTLQSPPVYIVFDAPVEALEHFVKEIQDVNKGIKFTTGFTNHDLGTVHFISFEKNKDTLVTLIESKKTSALILGLPHKNIETFVLRQTRLFLYIEDIGLEGKEKVSSLYDVASAFAPLTSYFSIIEEYWT